MIGLVRSVRRAASRPLSLPPVLVPLAVAATLGLTGLVLTAGPAAAQGITLKTVPIPTGEQFLLFPSQTLGMGSISIAGDDRLAAPFANPARRLEGDRLRVFATPTFYGETNRWVGGRSLPVSALATGERLHGGFAIATQQLLDRRRVGLGGRPAPPEGSNLREDPTNTYLFGTVGARVTDRSALGVSVFHARLGAVDGVNMLYGRSHAIEQSGRLSELRLGFAHDFGDERRLEGTITNTRLDMTHDVNYLDWVWDEGVEPWTTPPTVVEWQERNEDHTITWGTRWRYSQAMDHASRVGLILAGSTKAHPKIPNYNIVDIPRDPGNTAVFNIGAGVIRSEDGATIGLELVIEPARSHTWAFADTTIALPSGATLEPGDKTVDNQFRFLNYVIALGMERETRWADFQLGLRVRQISYSLEQENFLAERIRNTQESWLEWTPSWGALGRLGSMDFQYAGRFTTKGWPDMMWFGRMDMAVVDSPGGVDFMVGPTGPVSLPSYRVTTHRFTVSVPFGI
jgi:hypothetical protein